MLRLVVRLDSFAGQTAGSGPQGAADVLPRHERSRGRQGQELRRRVACQRNVLQRGSRQGRADRRGCRSAVEPRLRQPALSGDPVARCMLDRTAAESCGRSARRHADGQGVARTAHRQRGRFGEEARRRNAQGLLAPELAKAWMEYLKDTRCRTPRRRPRPRRCACSATR